MCYTIENRDNIHRDNNNKGPDEHSIKETDYKKGSPSSKNNYEPSTTNISSTASQQAQVLISKIKEKYQIMTSETKSVLESIDKRTSERSSSEMARPNIAKNNDSRII